MIASPDHGAPSVAVNLWYDVGSRDEEPGRTGFAHLFEHVMFQGSAHVPSGQHIGLLQAAGASVNATTWFDRTNYFETLPTGGLDLALWLEADRLGTLLDALTQESLDNQREVVKEEKRQRYDNVPYGDAMELLNALTFPADHPYGHTTIGSMEDLNAATLEDVQAFFRTHYLPNNAVLSIVGDVDPDDAFARAATYFGPLTAGEKPAKPVGDPLGPLTGTDREETSGVVPAEAVYLSWRLPAARHPRVRRARPGVRRARPRPDLAAAQATGPGHRARRGRRRDHDRADRRQLVRVRVRPGPGRRRPRAAGGRADRRGRPARAPRDRPSRSCAGRRPSTSGTGCTNWPGSTPGPTRSASTPRCTATRT